MIAQTLPNKAHYTKFGFNFSSSKLKKNWSVFPGWAIIKLK